MSRIRFCSVLKLPGGPRTISTFKFKFRKIGRRFWYANRYLEIVMENHQVPSTIDEHERSSLIVLARGGDRAAIGRLLHSYQGYLTILAQVEIGRHLQRKVDAQDLVQEVFLEAHRQFTQFRGETEAELTEWLQAIMAGVLANTIRRYLGTQARDLRLERNLADELHQSSCQLAAWAIDPQSSPSAHAVRSEQQLTVALGLSQLQDDYREVLVMRHLEGLTFSEIAARLERSVDSVEKLWVRGLAKLKQLCSGGIDPGPL